MLCLFSEGAILYSWQREEVVSEKKRMKAVFNLEAGRDRLIFFSVASLVNMQNSAPRCHLPYLNPENLVNGFIMGQIKPIEVASFQRVDVVPRWVDRGNIGAVNLHW